MDNSQISRVLEDTALLLEVVGANPFRIRAYRNAATTILDHGRPLADMVRDDEDLTRLEFIGKDLAAALRELVQSGRLKALEEVSEKVPLSLLQVLRLPGLGPKKAARLFQELGIVDLDSLENAARKGEIAALSGFGKKTEETLLKRVEWKRGESS